jgi:hypothetical protein
MEDRQAFSSLAEGIGSRHWNRANIQIDYNTPADDGLILSLEYDRVE